MPAPAAFPLLPALALQELGTRVAVSRRARGLTQRDLAHLADVGVSTIVALEKGHPGVALGTLARALDAIDKLPELDEVLAPARDQALTDYALAKLAGSKP